ncbi:MAG TPA: universal stress protein [Polyangiaceae bacterium]|nr:universal stress protein [Polyangiaceae bacterium]
MQQWKNVLVHADASVDRRGAIQQAFEIAEACEGRLTLFESISTGYVDGHPDSTRALLKYAARTSADLIVGTASRTDIRELTPRGASALQLLRSSPVPVWLCAPAAVRAARVVAAVDLSTIGADSRKLNEEVALAAARLSLIHHAELHVVCVADAARDRIFRSIMRPAQYSRHLAQHRAELRAALDELVTRIGARPIAHLIEGDAVEALDRLLVDLRADMLVLGRDNSNPQGVLRSDLAEQLLCRADRSLLLVHSTRAPARVDQSVETRSGARV